MSLLSTHIAASLLSLLAACRPVSADASALWLEPSLKWYGIDGNWSALGLYVGEPAQQVDVTVSTALSEIWVVDDGGCGSSALCTAARGNVYNVSASTSWDDLGAWQLGLGYLGQQGNGDYAMETVVAYDSVTRQQTSMHKQVVAAINDTDYYTGFFGLGITPGRFGGTVVQSPLAALVERDGVIPSHSYGYTAGAYYGGQAGTPLSLTLGGYDEHRFVSHDTTFSLNSTSRLPATLIRGITASVTSVDKAPTAWTSTSQTLMSFDESVTALIDTSTPYLWLPTAVCDRFASALNLTWNETFGLYLFSDNTVFESFSEPDLSFTFSLSSFDNTDNFGNPLAVSGVVNITISANAFAQTLRYPFMNVIGYGDAAVPYFPLRRTGNDSQFIIGRSFMQEAYIKTDYETSTFSIHQALFPDNPAHNTSIVTTRASADSPYPGPAGSGDEGRLPTSAIVGIVIGACLILVSILFTVWWMRRRRRKQMELIRHDSSMKDGDSCMDSEPPTTPVAKIFSRFSRVIPGRRSRLSRGVPHEMTGDSSQPAEVGGQERYEMAVPPPPVELDAADAHSIHDGTMDLATESSHDLNSYEMARRKMDRQLQGPVPEYTVEPSATEISTMETPFEEGDKSRQDISREPHYRPSDRSLRSDRSLSPASTPTYDNFSYYSIPSPVTPYAEWPREWPGSSSTSVDPVPDLVHSPTSLTAATGFSRSISNPGSAYNPPSPNTLEQRSLGRSISSGSPRSNPAALAPSGSSFPRAFIDTTKVVCLGPLPDNIRPPHPGTMMPPPRFMNSGSDVHGPGPSSGPSYVVPTMPPIPSAGESRRQSMIESRRQSMIDSRRQSTADTLGSNFTVEEEAQLREEIEWHATFHMPVREESEHSDDDGLESPHTAGTLEMSYSMGGGLDLVHIPEPPRPAAATPNAERLGTRADLVHIPTPLSPNVVPTSASQRIIGHDLVHVPQPASKRYSWEAS